MACSPQAPLHAHSNGNTTDGDDDNDEQSKLLHDRLARFVASPGSTPKTEDAAHASDPARALEASLAATRRSEDKDGSHDGMAEALAQEDDMCGPWMCAGVTAGMPAPASASSALLTVQPAASASSTASSPLLAPPAHWTPRSHAFTHTHHFLREQAAIHRPAGASTLGPPGTHATLPLRLRPPTKTLAPDRLATPLAHRSHRHTPLARMPEPDATHACARCRRRSFPWLHALLVARRRLTPDA